MRPSITRNREKKEERNRFRPNQDIESILIQQRSELRRQRFKRNLIIQAAAGAAVVLALLLLFGVVRIHGNAMAPNLTEGDLGLVWKGAGSYAAGDIVLCRLQPRTGIQALRVVAVPGDVVSIDGGKLFVNGEAPQESYVNSATHTVDLEFPITLGEKEYFLLGDNRISAVDSRYADVGPIPSSKILGKMLFFIRGN